MGTMRDGCRHACGHARHALPKQGALALPLASVLCLAAAGAVAACMAADLVYALIDGFERIMYVLTCLGANPFGWTL